MDWNNLSDYAIFGFTLSALLVVIFVISCIVSAVKAVRDRQHIKDRIRARRTAQANGDVSDSYRKHRPNILIIHDGEREARVKMGSAAPRTTLSPDSAPSSSPRHLGSGSGISSPGEEEQVSRHTETTVLAEVAYHRSSLCSSSNISPGMGETVDGVGGSDAIIMTNGRCYPSEPRSKRRDNVNDTPTRRNNNNFNNYDNIRDNNAYSGESRTGSVDFDGDAVAYRTRSTPRRSSGRGLSKKKSRSLDCPYSSNKARSGSRSPKNRRSHSSAAAERRDRKEGWSNHVCSTETSPVRTTTINHFGRYRYTITASDGDLHRSARLNSRDSDNPGRQKSADTNSMSFHGFTKNPSAGRTAPSALSSSSYAHTAAAVAGRHMKEHPMCAAYSPRRDSYAVAVDNTGWVDMAPVRRHSDEPLQRYPADCNRSVDSGNSSSTSHLYQKHSKNPVRARYRQQEHIQEGAENHAYEAAGDSSGENIEL